MTSQDVKEFTKVMEAHRDVAAHLCKRSFEDQAYEVCVPFLHDFVI